MKTVKCLSIIQPWASLCVSGEKKIETRSWNTKYRGELYIHASKGVAAWQGLWHQEPFKSSLKDVPPFGAIIGKVDLIDVMRVGELEKIINRLRCPVYKDKNGKITIYGLTEKELAFGDYSENRYCWLLANPVMFDKPIPAKGKLGIWNYELEV